MDVNLTKYYFMYVIKSFESWLKFMSMAKQLDFNFVFCFTLY